MIRSTGSHPNEEVLKDLRKRKLCEKQKFTSFSIAKDVNFSLVIEENATDLTFDMLQRYFYIILWCLSGSWRTQKFKAYNFDAIGIIPSSGALHPLLKVREEFRAIFFEMG